MNMNAEISTQSTEIERLLKITNIMEIIGCARSKVYELVKAGILPPPIYITPTMPRWQQTPKNRKSRRARWKPDETLDGN